MRSCTFCVEVDGQVLEDVHVCGWSDGADARRLTLGVYELDGLSAHVQHQGVDQRNIVVAAGLVQLQVYT